MVHLIKGVTDKTYCGQYTDAVEALTRDKFLASTNRCTKCSNWKPKTKADQMAVKLIDLGYEEIPGKSKYREFSIQGSNNKFFIGKSGAIRFGKVASRSTSYTNNADKLFERLAK